MCNLFIFMCLECQESSSTRSPAILGFLVHAGWPLAGGGFRSCNSIISDVWLFGGSGSPLQPDVISLASVRLLRSATRRCNRTAHRTTGKIMHREESLSVNRISINS